MTHKFDNPALRALRANVTGKVESGEAMSITAITADEPRYTIAGTNGIVMGENVPFGDVQSLLIYTGLRAQTNIALARTLDIGQRECFDAYWVTRTS